MLSMDRLLGRATAWIALVAVALAVLFGGRSYAFCVPMQMVMSECCCEHAGDERDAKAPKVVRECCEKRSIDVLPGSTGHIAPPSLGDFAAIVPADPIPPPAFEAAASTWTRERRAYPARFIDARAGPHPPIYLLNRVFLI